MRIIRHLRRNSLQDTIVLTVLEFLFREATIATIEMILTMTATYQHCLNISAKLYAVIIINYYLKFHRRRLVLRESICLPLPTAA